ARVGCKLERPTGVSMRLSQPLPPIQVVVRSPAMSPFAGFVGFKSDAKRRCFLGAQHAGRRGVALLPIIRNLLRSEDFGQYLLQWFKKSYCLTKCLSNRLQTENDCEARWRGN